MNIILLSGGSGKRLWPLSNDIRSKQFIKIFKDENGEEQSMLQRVYGQIKAVDKDASITIATSKSQVSVIKNQLADKVNISVEPCRRDTFPAIVLSSCYLHDVLGVPEDEVVVVSPVDPYVDDVYFQAFSELAMFARQDENKLVLMGIEPTYPSEKYGYIIPDNADRVSTVSIFKEKPDAATAEGYIKQGALWNSGVFAFKLKYVLDVAHKLFDFKDYYELFDKYASLTKISFDYAVVEKESNITVMRYVGEWKDLGTWNTLTEAMTEPVIGKALLNDECSDVNVVNELNIPILCMGLQNLVVVAGPEGILISEKEQSSFIKPFVDSITQPIMFAEKSWGTYKVIDVQNGSLTIKVSLNSGNKMSYHSHDYRDEVWTVTSGQGRSIVDGMEQILRPGDVITIAAGCKHTVEALTDLEIIEVQIGEHIAVEDKNKYELE